MKSIVRLVGLAGLVLICATPGLAQTIPWEFYPPMPPMPPMPAMPAMPPMPPMPAMPPMPPMPRMEGFPFFYEQARGGVALDPQVSLQQEVFRSIIRQNADRALEIAAERLKADPADQVVLGNLSAIASSTSPKALPLLVSIAKTSPNLDARRSALSAIARPRNDNSGGLTVLEDLYNGMSDNVDMRLSIVSAIGRLSDPRTVTVLARIARSDADINIRRSAIQHLGRRSEAEANKVLEELLRNPGRN